MKLPAAGLVLAIAFAATGAAEEPEFDPVIENTSDLTVWPVKELGQSPTGGTLVGGIVQDPVKWPATVHADSNLAYCTGTLLGPDALLLAAHCVGDGRSVTIEFQNGDKKTGDCHHYSRYKYDFSADYAGCKLRDRVTGTTYETVQDDPSALHRMQRLRLAGFGCTIPDQPQSADGKYRAGNADIQTLPTGANTYPNYIISKGEIQLCQGDSGGAAYELDDGSDRQVGKVVGVNSRVWSKKNLSYVSALATPDGRQFLNEWIYRDGVTICGLTEGFDQCR